jgi:hypothetical protein
MLHKTHVKFHNQLVYTSCNWQQIADEAFKKISKNKAKFSCLDDN